MRVGVSRGEQTIQEADEMYRVILALTAGYLSGVDVFSCNLVRECRRLGIDARVLLTRPNFPVDNPLPIPPDVPCDTLPVGIHQLWRTRLGTMIQYLEDQAPCIYIPNYCTEYSCVSPRLSPRVGIVGIVHSDDPIHYDHVSALGEYWNAIVAVSGAIARSTVSLNSSFAQRLVVIPYGVSTPASAPWRECDARTPLRIVYAGRVVQRQKRVMDLPKIMTALSRRDVPAQLSVIGDGDTRRDLMRVSGSLVERRLVRFQATLPNDELLPVFEQNDVLLLPSAFEGLPVSLLEAMGRGCVPVVSDVRSGIPELIEDGVNGFRVDVGDIDGFADRLTLLYHDEVRRRQMSASAFHTIAYGGFHIEAMGRRYVSLFERVFEDARQGVFRRPGGKVPLYGLTTWKDRLPVALRAIGYLGKRLAQRTLGLNGRPQVQVGD